MGASDHQIPKFAPQLEKSTILNSLIQRQI